MSYLTFDNGAGIVSATARMTMTGGHGGKGWVR